MPFRVDIKHIEETENKLGLIFPEIFKEKMKKENGGEIETVDDVWQIIPFYLK